MIGKKPSPVIGNLNAGKLGFGNKSAAGPTSPTSPLEYKIQSPRGLRTYDVGGVGLGILAALEKSGPEIPTKISFCYRNFNRSDPIPVNSASNYNRGILEDTQNDTDSFEEEFTYVTRRNQSKSSTKVYRDGYEYSVKESRVSRKNNGGGCIFDISPARFCDSTPYHGTDFLSSCNLCKKKLHGKDIYMYRGEKAFCSKECRYRQIIKEEQKEKCRSEASRSNIDVSISPCKNGKMLSTGIFAI